MFSRTLYVQHPASLKIFPSLPGSRLRLFIAMQIQNSDEHTFVQQYALCAEPCARNCSSAELQRLSTCTNGNAQQNPLYVGSCATKDLPISSRFSPTIFLRDAISMLLRAHFFIASSTHVQRECSLEPFVRSVLCP